MKIEKVKGKWLLFSDDDKKVVGKFGSKETAEEFRSELKKEDKKSSKKEK